MKIKHLQKGIRINLKHAGYKNVHQLVDSGQHDGDEHNRPLSHTWRSIKSLTLYNNDLRLLQHTSVYRVST